MEKIVVFAMVAALAPVLPVTAAVPSVGMAACGDIADSQRRLACFDNELAKARQATPAPVASAPAAPAAGTPGSAPVAVAAAAAAISSPAPAAAPHSFADEHVASNGKEQTEEQRVMHARLSSQKEVGSSHIFNLFLDNGQVWRHEDAYLGSYLRVGDAVTITKSGGMGTYRLTRDGSKEKNWIRVQRVR